MIKKDIVSFLSTRGAAAQNGQPEDVEMKTTLVDKSGNPTTTP